AIVADPAFRQMDSLLVKQRMIAAKVHADKNRRLLDVVRLDQKHMNRLPQRWLLERDLDLAQRRLAAESPLVLEEDVVCLALRRRRQSAVHVVLKQGLELRLALRFPLLFGCDFPAVEHYERFRQIRIGSELIRRWEVGGERGGKQHGDERQR